MTLKGLVLVLVISVLGVRSEIRSMYREHVHFRLYKSFGVSDYKEHTLDDHEVFRNRSDGMYSERLAMITHGWRQSCDEDWVKMLVEKLQMFRAGQIVCMDYSIFASDENYFRLVRHSGGLAETLKQKLRDFKSAGYDPENMYLFGFSFGGQLVIEAGKRFGKSRIKEIDVCDMAGPGFERRPKTDHRLAAQNVQCIHTSREYGVRYSLCHQDWKMGNCGKSQAAANEPPYGSHGLCPYFYVQAFDNPFYAVKKPSNCRSKTEATSWPKKFQMGYVEGRKEKVQGELFALTRAEFPYNVLEKEGRYSFYRKRREGD